MGFADACNRFADKVEQRSRDVHAGVVDAIHGSIRDGSAITGAPGQPIGETRDLYDSWKKEITGAVGVVSSDDPAAPIIEDGIRDGKAIAITAPGGGSHSVKLTRAGFQLLVADVVQKVAD